MLLLLILTTQSCLHLCPTGKFYCPRMASMNKPAYAAIQIHSPLKPVLVFVASRRQTRLTAMDLISYAASDEKPTQFVHMDADELAVSINKQLPFLVVAMLTSHV